MMRVVCVLSSPGCRYALWNDKVESRHLLAWPKLHVMTESSKGFKNFTVHYVFLLLIREKGLVAYQEKRTADVLCRSCSLVFLLFFYYITGYGEKEDPNKRRCSFSLSQESSKEKKGIRAELNR